MKTPIHILLFVPLFFCSCNSSTESRDVEIPDSTNSETIGNISLREHSILSVLWVQHSAEYKALCYQAFNIAKFNLDNLVKLGFPFADSKHVLLRDTVRGKQPRRDHVLNDHDVIMLLGASKGRD